MLKIVDIVYHCHEEYTRPEQVLEKHQPTLGFVDFIKSRADYEVIRHLNFEGEEIINGIPYAFFKRRNAPWQVPYKTHRYIRSLKPDIIFVHGFIFPLQVIALRKAVGKKTLIVLQHHADKPAPSVRRIFQKIADGSVDAYMFSAAALAQPWVEQGIIKDTGKIIECCAASASVEKKNKIICIENLGLKGNSNFLWVGRLNKNKDPLTVLKGFYQYVSVNPAAALYMIYHTEELLAEVNEFISRLGLQSHVHLVGKLPHTELAEWYHAADFFISGSYEEAVGYALMEAICAGCIPVVTSIPSFLKITNGGKIGFLYQPGNAEGLLEQLLKTIDLDIRAEHLRTEEYFNKNLGFENIADNILAVALKLTGRPSMNKKEEARFIENSLP